MASMWELQGADTFNILLCIQVGFKTILSCCDTENNGITSKNLKILYVYLLYSMRIKIFIHSNIWSITSNQLYTHIITRQIRQVTACRHT